MTGIIMSAGGGEGVDPSSVTAEPNDVLNTKQFLNAEGELVFGQATPYTGDNPIAPSSTGATIAANTMITNALNISPVNASSVIVYPTWNKSGAIITPSEEGQFFSSINEKPMRMVEITGYNDTGSATDELTFEYLSSTDDDFTFTKIMAVAIYELLADVGTKGLGFSFIGLRMNGVVNFARNVTFTSSGGMGFNTYTPTVTYNENNHTLTIVSEGGDFVANETYRGYIIGY